MKSILPTLIAASLLIPAAAAADTVAADPEARQVTALGGTIVWVSGSQPAKLMQRNPDGTIARVKGTTDATAYRNPDLGRDAKSNLVLTYARCSTLTRCTYVRDDLAGNRSTLELAAKNCTVSSTPAIWKSSVAYGLSCFKRVNGKKVADNARSGLYLVNGTKRPLHFTAPRQAKRAGSLTIEDVDLRGAQVAAIYADIAAFAMVQSTTGSLRRTIRVATSEGDGDQRAAGVTIGTGDVRLWSLTRSVHVDSPAQSIIHRVANDCDDHQVIDAAAGPSQGEDHPLVDLTADNGTLYAVDPGVGVVTHAYARTAGC